MAASVASVMGYVLASHPMLLSTSMHCRVDVALAFLTMVWALRMLLTDLWRLAWFKLRGEASDSQG